MELSGKTLLITGIGGFIGLRTAELAQQRGMNVRGLQRTAAKAQQAEALGIEVLIGDTRDRDIVQRACDGVDLIIHAAGNTPLLTQANQSPDQLFADNVTGTINVATLAAESGVKAFVHFSSVTVYGPEYPDGTTEQTPIATNAKVAYVQSKIAAEQQLHALPASDLGIIILRSGLVYGPGDIHLLTHPLKLLKEGKFALIDGGKGQMNNVHIDNLIHAIFLALEKEAYGETFNILDDPIAQWKDYYIPLAHMMGYSTPLSIPTLMAKAAAKMGNYPDLTAESVMFHTRHNLISIEKAKTQLGYHPQVSIQAGMAAIADWLKQRGYNGK